MGRKRDYDDARRDMMDRETGAPVGDLDPAQTVEFHQLAPLRELYEGGISSGAKSCGLFSRYVASSLVTTETVLMASGLATARPRRPASKLPPCPRP